MKQPIKGILKQADHNPVRVGDKILITTQPHGDGGNSGGKNPKPRKTLEERVASVIKELVPNMIDNAMQPLRNDINEVKLTLNTVVRLNNLKTK